jgi:hypothetical protein
VQDLDATVVVELIVSPPVEARRRSRESPLIDARSSSDVHRREAVGRRGQP